ncbi:YscO family type III secretion system apparatus protein [Noviherbaspirillum sp. CPCC 100848]|uniref:YscO family type III secretion system apparatus protein n=1 Tax=Noviherbaspirillum album TaxID=3080276 RepID=A0ABU6JAQ1_9BURK|nr:YscO family type III secretion system apparatus protein [Noviherbaspirillum sp. CPCC 100848]MEC4720724.1 YscO family type III secretion system apparatus protein [Noviherbaspirillum sp. CPCC 100848]
MSVFQELLAIKTFRKNKAEMALSRSRLMLADANAARDLMQQRLTEYRKQADEQEKAWYRDLCTRIVRLADIEDLQQSVVMLRQRERNHEEALAEAEKARQQATEAFNTDREQLAVANRMREKFVELAQAHEMEVGRESERKEDLEMEEAASVSRDREEWGGVEND